MLSFKELHEGLDLPESSLAQELREHYGFVPKIFSFIANNSRLVQAKAEAYKALFLQKNSSLERGEKELIALIIALKKSSKYCVEHHFRLLQNYGFSYDLSSRIKQNYRDVEELDPKIRALLAFVEDLVDPSKKIGEGDFEILKDQGWNQDAIQEVLLIYSELTSLNELANVLDLDIEKEIFEDYNSRTPIQR